jgi:hypothetical protein
MTLLHLVPEPEPDFTAEPCVSRMHDCRCVWEEADHVQLHMCGVPGCSALWTQSGAIVRLPGKAA